MMAKIKTDLTDKKFNKLKVIKRVANQGIQPMWLCKCDCGQYTIVRGHHIKTGHTKSCGCLVKETATKHGYKHTDTYRVWTGMKQRCNNKCNPKYQNYGGRNIVVCKRWLRFENFLADMGERPSDMSIDRIDNNQGYYPSNCKWSTAKEQSVNRRTNINITINYKTQCLAEWCRESNLKYTKTLKRLNRGWSIYKALELE